MNVASLSSADLAVLSEKATWIRRQAVTMVHASKSGHLGSALSAVELLTVLYGAFLKTNPNDPRWPERDRFILSKGHGGSGLYATLAAFGHIPEALLQTYGKDGGTLAVHPSSMIFPQAETSTGSLGHGFPIGVGMAIAAQRDGKSHRVVTIVSDGECDEGSTWEAALFSGHHHLDQLLCIVDYNKIQSFGRTEEVLSLEPFADKWKAFGWGVREVDGHDIAAIAKTLSQFPFDAGKPSVIIAHTVKGKGLPQAEDTVSSHYLTPTEEQLRALCTP